MKTLVSKAKALSDEIIASEIYSNFVNIHNEIKNDSKTMEQILAFRKKQQELSSLEMLGHEISFDEEKSIGNMYFNLKLHENAHKYLEAEKELLTLLASVQENLVSGLNIDFSFDYCTD